MKKEKNSSPNLEEEEKPPPSTQGLLNQGSFFVAPKGAVPFYPHYFDTHLPLELQKLFTSNGHLKLMQSLQIEFVSDLERCYQLWQEFAPQQTLFDTWEFRLAFYQGYQHVPIFILLKDQTENLALLPIWYESDKKKYFWFGSWWQEENSFFAKDPLFIPLLLNVCPSPILLNAIRAETALSFKNYLELEPDDPKYVLNLEQIRSVDDYLTRFHKKKRYNLRRDRRMIEEKNPQLIYNRFEDLDLLIELAKKRFYEKGEDTDWDDPRRVETFRQVIQSGLKDYSYQLRMLTVEIENQVAAVDLILIYNDCYAPVKCGYNVKSFSGIGNYVNLIEIEDALNLGCKKIDFLELNYGWKERWFEEVPLFKYERE